MSSPQKRAQPKAAYSRPTLTIYGDVATLTASGTGVNVETANDAGRRRRP